MTQPPKVVNKYKESYDVYIGRGSLWGNPYPLLTGHTDEDRVECIEMYRRYLWMRMKTGEITKEDFECLSGKVLGCFCKPKKCHGDVIVEAYKWIME